MRKYILLSFLLLLSHLSNAQKVGVVLSGGGAKGLAHIGTLKALEEHNIPIDYITGTSMGGIVGALYAAGYSPKEIEEIALSSDFQNWVVGRYQSDYTHYFKKNSDNASLISAKLMVRDNFRLNFRSNLISDIPLNLALQELLAQASAASKNDFDSLFIPFRAMVSDVISQESISVSKGSLAEAARATMTVPLIYRPIKIDGKFVFDGGLYNNFPIDIMKQDFNPDFIIGANVSSKTFNEYPTTEDERLMNQMLMFMFLAKSDSTLIGENGVYIQPNLAGINATMFSSVKEIIQKGYDATILELSKIQGQVARRVSDEDLHLKRKAYNRSKPDYAFSNISASGINSQQQKYVERLFKTQDGIFSLEDIKRGYYKLVADETFETVYPTFNYDTENKTYHLDVVAEPTKNLKIDIGGNISTRPISNVFLGLQYNYLRRKSYNIAANFYSGKFYESVQVSGRIDFPTRIPLFLGAELTYNNLNYFSSSRIFIENTNPTYVEQSDRKIEVNMGVPLNNNSKVVLKTSFINNRDRFSPNNTFNEGDALDRNLFNGWRSQIAFDQNNLNRKQYPNAGKKTHFSFSYLTGQENYTPGNILRDQPYYFMITGIKQNRNWWKIQASTESYFASIGKNTFGYLAELVISNQPEYANYYSTLLAAPAFYPLQDSRSLFLHSFRSSSYLAGGLKNIYALKRNLDFRVEGYFFLPYESHFQVSPLRTEKGTTLSDWNYAATAGLVYNTRLGPVSISYNLYSDKIKKHGVLLHLGYLLYNKRSLE